MNKYDMDRFIEKYFYRNLDNSLFFFYRISKGKKRGKYFEY